MMRERRGKFLDAPKCVLCAAAISAVYPVPFLHPYASPNTNAGSPPFSRAS